MQSFTQNILASILLVYQCYATYELFRHQGLYFQALPDGRPENIVLKYPNHLINVTDPTDFYADLTSAINKLEIVKQRIPSIFGGVFDTEGLNKTVHDVNRS